MSTLKQPQKTKWFYNGCRNPFFFFFPSLNLITFEGSSLFRKIIKLPLTPLWQEFDHRLETISFKPRICVLKEEWPIQTTPEICFPLVTTNLLGCAIISRTQLQNEKFQMYSCAALKGKSKTKKGYFALTNLFFKTRFCKDQWESTEVIWSATPWTAERDRGYQEHTEPRTGHKIITALETPQPLSTHIWCFCKVLMFHSRTNQWWCSYSSDSQIHNIHRQQHLPATWKM